MHRAEILSDDARLTSVCLSVCLSVAYIGPKSRTARPWRLKLAQRLPKSDTTFKIKRSKCELAGAAAYWDLPHSLLYSACLSLCMMRSVIVFINRQIWMNEFSVDHLHCCSQPNKNNQETPQYTNHQSGSNKHTQRTLQHHVYRVYPLWTIKSKAIKTFELIHFWLRKSLQCGSRE